MKKAILFFYLLISIIINAQSENNQFVRTFSKVSTTNDNGEFEEYKDGKNTLVFNYGDGYDIKFYKANGDSEILSRISDVKEDKTREGREYQWNRALNEKGLELIFVLYSDGEVRMLYTDKLNGKFSFAISLIP